MDAQWICVTLIPDAAALRERGKLGSWSDFLVPFLCQLSSVAGMSPHPETPHSATNGWGMLTLSCGTMFGTIESFDDLAAMPTSPGRQGALAAWQARQASRPSQPPPDWTPARSTPL